MHPRLQILLETKRNLLAKTGVKTPIKKPTLSPIVEKFKNSL
jgi:hypothetical protein